MSAKLDQHMVAVRKAWAAGDTVRQIAERYGVCLTTVQNFAARHGLVRNPARPRRVMER